MTEMDPVTPPSVGIARQGASNSCYINASMQMLYCIPAVRRAVDIVRGVPWTDAVGRIFRALGDGTAVDALVVPRTNTKGEKSTFVVSQHVQSLGDLLGRTADTALGQMGDPTQTILFAMDDLFDNEPTLHEGESHEHFTERKNAILKFRNFRPELEKVTCHAMFRKYAKCPSGYTDGRDHGGEQWSVLDVGYFSVIQLKANECWSKLKNGKERAAYPPTEQLIQTISGLLRVQGTSELVENTGCKGKYHNKIVYTVHSKCMYVMLSISRNRIQVSTKHLKPILGSIEADDLVFAVNDGLLDGKHHLTEEQEPRSFRVIGAILFVLNHYVFVRINDNAKVTHYYDDDSVTIGIPQCTDQMKSWGITVAQNAVQLLYRCIVASPDQARLKRKRDEELTVEAETSTERPDGYNDNDGSSYVIQKLVDKEEKEKHERLEHEKLAHEAFTEKERIAKEQRLAAKRARIAKAQQLEVARSPREVIDLSTGDDVPTTFRAIYSGKGELTHRVRVDPKPKPKLTFGSIVRAASMYRQ